MVTSTALATGAEGGIGLHIAREFAELGWTVHVGARDAARGAKAAGQFGRRPLVRDVTDADTIATAAPAVPELDVLVNNAGISLDTGAPVTGADVDVLRRPRGLARIRAGLNAKGIVGPTFFCAWVQASNSTRRRTAGARLSSKPGASAARRWCPSSRPPRWSS